MKSSYKGVTLVEGGHIYSEGKLTPSAVKPADRLKTIAYSILSSHNESPITEDTTDLRIRFDAMASHDITYVGTPLGNTKRPCLILQKNQTAMKQNAPQRVLQKCSATIFRRSSLSRRAMPGCLL